MIGTEGIVGRITLFICQKAVSQLAKLTLDKKRKACRALTRLYFCLQGLDEATEGILRTVREEMRGTTTGEAWVVMNAINNHMRDIASASNLFVDLARDLYAGLLIIDPALARCCSALYVGKMGFLSEMSNAVAWDRSTGTGRLIVRMPAQVVDLAILERSYAALERGEKAYWPDTWVPSDGPGTLILTWEDDAASAVFVDRLAQHRTVLLEAKEQLRQLLKDNFSVDELLYETARQPTSS